MGQLYNAPIPTIKLLSLTNTFNIAPADVLVDAGKNSPECITLSLVFDFRWLKRQKILFTIRRHVCVWLVLTDQWHPYGDPSHAWWVITIGQVIVSLISPAWWSHVEWTIECCQQWCCADGCWWRHTPCNWWMPGEYITSVDGPVGL